jgi:mannose-1-phosphate guanylyltransferase
VEEKKFSKAAIDAFYAEAASISVDYGIMEHAQKVYAVAGTFTWDDVGAWEAMTRIHPQDASGNTLAGGTAVALDCSDTIIFNQTSGSVAAIGLDNAAIVVADGVTMVISRDKLPDLKKYLAAIKKGGKLPPELF